MFLNQSNDRRAKLASKKSRPWKTAQKTLVGLTAGAALLFNAAAQAQTKNVMVHLFEWKWNDIKTECQYLEEKGYGSIQVSPPNEHAVINGHPWWQRYQPVSYELDNSRSGTLAEFESMVETCWKDHGVKVIVDAVVNHMAAGSGTGSNGTSFTGASDYLLFKNPDVRYTGLDFHSQCAINWGQQFVPASEIRNCWVAGGGLPDLKTEDTGHNWVRNNVTRFLNSMIDMGVAGFRIDAAKHMNPDDVTSIYSSLNNLRSDAGWFDANSRPFVFQEVIFGSGQGSTPEQYDNDVNVNGVNSKLNVTEFRYGQNIGVKFRNDASGNISQYITDGFPVASAGWGMLDSAYSVVFTDNHDNQRGHGSGFFTSSDNNSIGGIVTHFYDGAVYNLSNVFMLAWPYGTPKVMSSYDWQRNVGPKDGGGFQDFNDGFGPPSDSNGNTNGADCGLNEWICEHRWGSIAGMVGFNNYTQDAWAIDHTWHNNNNQIAFARVTPGGQSRGFVVINREGGSINQSFFTGLPAGEYCDVSLGAFNFNTDVCTGSTITVDNGGNAVFSVPAMSASAIHVGALAGSPPPPGDDVNVNFTCQQGNTNPGQSVYVVGDNAALGNWNASPSLKLDPVSYPTWSGTIAIPAQTTFAWKCVIADETTLVIDVWQGGNDNALTTQTTDTSTSASF